MFLGTGIIYSQVTVYSMGFPWRKEDRKAVEGAVLRALIGYIHACIPLFAFYALETCRQSKGFGDVLCILHKEPNQLHGKSM